MIYPCCDLQLGQGWLIYRWRRVGLSDGGSVNGRSKRKAETPTGGVGIDSTVIFLCPADSFAGRPSGAVVVPGNQPNPPRACPHECENAATPEDSALCVTGGVGARTGVG